jgi:hypothetical protein
MKGSIGLFMFWSIMVAMGQDQKAAHQGSIALTRVSSTEGTAYTIQGTTLERERLLRTQIHAMNPLVLPKRIVFVPHWQYIYATKMYHLQVPKGMTSKMFSHLPSRTVYIDSDLYGGNDCLGYWIAHELGHLERNNADENQAEKSAATYRRRLEHTHK